MSDTKEPRLPSPSAIDLSKSGFRGSGALYQSDRLTVGRSKTPQLVGIQTALVEKVIYKESETSAAVIADLRNKLKESLLRLLVVSADHKRLTTKVNSPPMQLAHQRVFENEVAMECQSLKVEISRLHQLLADKDKEVQFVREAETRKSAVQTGELTVRLSILNKENHKLQAANLDRISQLSIANAEINKLREELTVKATTQSLTVTDSRTRELESLVIQKEQEIESLRRGRNDNVSLSRECSELKAYIADLESKLRYSDQVAVDKEQVVQQMRREIANEQKQKVQIDHQNLEVVKREKDLLESRIKQMEILVKERETVISHHASELQKVDI
jgi:hypothetical protein